MVLNVPSVPSGKTTLFGQAGKNFLSAKFDFPAVIFSSFLPLCRPVFESANAATTSGDFFLVLSFYVSTYCAFRYLSSFIFLDLNPDRKYSKNNQQADKLVIF